MACKGNPEPEIYKQGKLGCNGFRTNGKARIAGAKGLKTQADRRALRQQMLEIAVKNGLIAKHFSDAITNRDPDLIEFCTKAMTLVGLDFKSSPEMVQKIQVDAKTDNTLNIKIEDA